MLTEEIEDLPGADLLTAEQPARELNSARNTSLQNTATAVAPRAEKSYVSSSRPAHFFSSQLTNSPLTPHLHITSKSGSPQRTPLRTLIWLDVGIWLHYFDSD